MNELFDKCLDCNQCPFECDFECEPKEEVSDSETKGSRKTGLAYRRKMNKKKTHKLVDVITTRNALNAGHIETDEVNGVWVPVGKYIKYRKNSERQKSLKRQSNRALRRGDDCGSGKGGYKKVFDYWWNLY